MRAPFQKLRSSLAAGLLLAGLCGCSFVVEPEVEELGAPPATCSPGTVVDCACLGGRLGQQRCSASGSYERCQCGAAGSGS